MKVNRRTFIRTFAAACAAGNASYVQAQQLSNNFLFGIRTEPDMAAQLKAVGYDFIEIGVATSLKPEISDEAFAPEMERLKNCALPIRSCNQFIPPQLKLVGPLADHDKALKYAITACRRAGALGIPYIILGSGAARRVPVGFDPAEAKIQFIDFCQKLGDLIKDLKVTVIIEQLNKSETNLINTLTECCDYVDAIERERIKLLADFYHMSKDGEDSGAILKAGNRILHCQIAERENRMAPGTYGEDFSAFFKALKDIGYRGGISCESSWPAQNIEAAWIKALKTMRSQAGF